LKLRRWSWHRIRVIQPHIRLGTCSKCSIPVPSTTRRALSNGGLRFSITQVIRAKTAKYWFSTMRIVPLLTKTFPYSSRNAFQSFHSSSKYKSTSSIQPWYCIFDDPNNSCKNRQILVEGESERLGVGELEQFRERMRVTKWSSWHSFWYLTYRQPPSSSDAWDQIHTQLHPHISSTLIIFPYLIFLDLYSAPADYAKQFLLKKNAHLPRLLYLCIGCKSLRCITNNFTIDPTHFNFGTLKRLHLRQEFYYPENFHQYFPLL